MIRPVTPVDAKAILAIYNPFVLASTVTFEEVAVTPDDMAARIRAVTATLPWLGFEVGGVLAGYAYATQWKPRSAYRHTVESAIYVDPTHGRRGIGRKLYEALFVQLRARSIHAVLGGIALPNDPSVALHEQLGFEQVGHLREVGFKLGQWVDVGYWEKRL